MTNLYQGTGYTITAAANTTNMLWFNSTIGAAATIQAWTPARPPVATPHEGFNKYVNASDLLEEFIAFLGTEGVRKGEIMALPVELFIKWLVIRACEVDREEPGVVLTLPAPRPQPRCLGCGRWMARATPLPLHGARCASWHFARAIEDSLRARMAE